VSEGEHPLREAFLAFVHPDYRAALAAPLKLLYHLLLALRGPDVPAYGGVPDLPAQAAAAVRDLRWTAAYLRGGIAGPAFGSSLEYEEDTLARYVAEFSFKLDALTGELETFLAEWQPAEPRP
jgi:hypothetical protein